MCVLTSKTLTFLINDKDSKKTNVKWLQLIEVHGIILRGKIEQSSILVNGI